MEDVETKAQNLYKGVALAPMVRASTTPLRTLALRYGADLVFTEEMIDRSLSNTFRTVTNNGMIDYVRDMSDASAKVKKRLAKNGETPLIIRIDPEIEKGKLVCQLGTGDPNFALKAALHIHQDVDAIDINMGCPKKFSVSGGMGSALLSDPGRAASIIKTLRGGLPHKPISCKIRIIEDTMKTLDFCTAMINAGAMAISIHGRRVGDESTKPADWKTLTETLTLLKSKFPSIPIMMNGDFYTRKEWTDMMEETKADGVLLARPALYNTSIFRRPPSNQTTMKHGYDSPLLLEKTCVVQDYLRECVRYNTHYKNVKYVICEMMNNRRSPPNRTPHLIQKYPGGQTVAKTCNCHSVEDICKLWNVNCLDEKKELPFFAGEHRYEDSYFLDKIRTKEMIEPGNEACTSKKKPKLL